MDINNFDSNQDIINKPLERKENGNKKNKKIFFVSILVLILILVSVGVFSYYFYNNYYLTPEKIVGKMFNNLRDINSFEYNGEIKTTVSYDESLSDELPIISNSSFLLEMSFYGKFFEEEDRSNLKNELNLITKIGFLADGLNLSLDLDLDIKNNKEEFYFKFNQFPPIPILTFDNLKNKWIKFNLKEDFAEMEIEEEYKKQREFFDIIEKEFLKGEILDIREVFPNKDINGTNLYHYGFGLNKEELDRIIDIALESESDYIKDDARKMKESLEFFNIKDGEIFIGKKDLLPHRISFNSYLDTEGISFQSTSITFDFNNFNKNFEINFPEDSYSVEEIFTELSKETTF